LLSDLAPTNEETPAEDVVAEDAAVDATSSEEAVAEAPAAADSEAEKE
jgi:hypothetical protein